MTLLQAILVRRAYREVHPLEPTSFLLERSPVYRTAVHTIRRECKNGADWRTALVLAGESLAAFEEEFQTARDLSAHIGKVLLSVDTSEEI